MADINTELQTKIDQLISTPDNLAALDRFIRVDPAAPDYNELVEKCFKDDETVWDLTVWDDDQFDVNGNPSALALRLAAIKKRIALVPPNDPAYSETFKIEFCTAADAKTARELIGQQAVFGNLAGIPGWNPETEDQISNADIMATQAVVKEQLTRNKAVELVQITDLKQLNALNQAATVEDFKKLLVAGGHRNVGWIDSAAMVKLKSILIQRIEALNQINLINNSALAEVLGSLFPPFKVTEAQRIAINQDLNLLVDDFEYPAGNNFYVGFLRQHIWPLPSKWVDEAQRNQAFGLNDAGDAIATDPDRARIWEGIRDQHNHARGLAQALSIPADRRASRNDAANPVMEAFMRTAMPERILAQQAAALEAAFIESGLYPEFLDKVSKIPAIRLDPKWQDKVTAEVFYQAKLGQMDHMNAAEKEHYIDGILTASGKQLKLDHLDSPGARWRLAGLERLGQPGSLRAEQLFSPKYTQKARANAKQYRSVVEKYIEDTQVVLNLLEYQKSLLDGIQGKIGQGQNAELDDRLLKMNQLVRDYSESITHARNVLAAMADSNLSRQVKTRVAVQQIAEKPRLEDYRYAAEAPAGSPAAPGSRAAVVADYRTANPPTATAMGMAAGVTPSKEYMNAVGSLPAGKVNQYDVIYRGGSGEESTGRFTESHNAQSKAQVKPLVYTVVDVPHQAAFSDFEKQEAKVDYAMTMATQLLANLDKPPSKKDPLFVKGEDPELVALLWTSLAYLGKNTPGMKFGTEAIRVDCEKHVFDPATQKSWRGFNQDSYYYSHFANSPVVKTRMEQFLQATVPGKEAKAAEKTMSGMKSMYWNLREKEAAAAVVHKQAPGRRSTP